MSFYETDEAASEYLLFHYGSAAQILPYPFGPAAALDYAVRCVRECLDAAALPASARALDLGCAVGRASFELARHCNEVIGIDFSARFIAEAERMQTAGRAPIRRLEEGSRFTEIEVVAPEGIDRSRVRFRTGDAMKLPRNIGRFDAVLMANLLDRLPDPRRCLEQIGDILAPGGQLIITSPYSWLREYAPQPCWLAGGAAGGGKSSLDEIRDILAPSFKLMRTLDLPFLIREHARKYQWNVAQASVWRRL